MLEASGLWLASELICGQFCPSLLSSTSSNALSYGAAQIWPVWQRGLTLYLRVMLPFHSADNAWKFLLNQELFSLAPLHLGGGNLTKFLSMVCEPKYACHLQACYIIPYHSVFLLYVPDLAVRIRGLSKSKALIKDRATDRRNMSHA